MTHPVETSPSDEIGEGKPDVEPTTGGKAPDGEDGVPAQGAVETPDDLLREDDQPAERDSVAAASQNDDAGVAEPQAAEPQVAEPQAAEPQVAEPQAAEPRPRSLDEADGAESAAASADVAEPVTASADVAEPVTASADVAQPVTASAQPAGSEAAAVPTEPAEQPAPGSPEVAVAEVPDPEGPTGEAGSSTTAETEAEEEPTQTGGGGLGAFVRETAIVLVTALVLSLLIKTFLIQAFFIPSVSMEDTLLVGDRVLVSKLTPGPFELKRGDIVVFKDPGGWLPPAPEPDDGPVRHLFREAFTFIGLLPSDSGEHLIKRVIGVGGDVVECCDSDGRLTVNGESIDEAEYLYPGAPPSSEPFKVTVPQGRLWVMGDNRDNSRDSRANRGNGYDGTIPVDNVVGRSFVIVWPAGRFDWLSNPSSVFEDVPAP